MVAFPKIACCGFVFCAILFDRPVCRYSARFMRPFFQAAKQNRQLHDGEHSRAVLAIYSNQSSTQVLVVRPREEIWIFQDCKTDSISISTKLKPSQVQSEGYKSEGERADEGSTATHYKWVDELTGKHLMMQQIGALSFFREICF